MSETKRDARLPLFLLALIVIVLDQLTKWLAATRIQVGDHVIVIAHIFAISHVENPGAAFSMFNDSSSPGLVRWMLLGFSVVASIAVSIALLKLGRKITATTVSLALILGGAVGNAWDRIRYGYVIDFLEVHIVHYHWPDFNLADSALVTGEILLFLSVLFPGLLDRSENG